MIRIKIRKGNRQKKISIVCNTFICHCTYLAWLIASESGAIKEIFFETTKCGELLYRVHQGWKPASEHRHQYLPGSLTH